jgi:hypothetical protein
VVQNLFNHNREKLSMIGKNYIMASNRYDLKSRLVAFRQLWFIPRGRPYEKRLIRVRERPYSARGIRKMAKPSGFRVLKVTQQ